MNKRDNARSDLYLAQLRMQSAPNTPGLPQHRDGLASHKSPMGMNFPKTVHDSDDSDNDSIDNVDAAEKGRHHGMFDAEDREYEVRHNNFHMSVTPPPDHDAREENVNEHVPAAPGEQTYAAVPIPGAYASPVASPSFAPAQAMHYPAEAR